MDLRNDIKKMTSLTLTDNNAKFYRLHGLSQAAKDKKMNERKVRKPRNLHILEDSDDNMDVISDKVKPTFDKYEVSAAVREINGGRDLSNKHWEENFFRNLKDMDKSEKKISQNCSKYNIKANRPEDKDLNDKYTKQKNKFCRNAAIMGLVNTKKIALQDLINFNESTARKKNKSETLHGTAFNENIMDDDNYQVESIPLREDPEIFVHPLQIGIDTKKYKDIDFTLTRIGRKKKVTPRDYFIEATDDAFFDFVKPNST